MDSIRITKLLELFQYTTLSFFMGFVMGSIINHYLPESNENISTSELFSEIIIEIFLISSSLYYCHKMLKLIKLNTPFLFSLTKRYVPCKKGECDIGIALGFSLSFYHVLIKFKNKMDILQVRLSKKL